MTHSISGLTLARRRSNGHIFIYMYSYNTHHWACCAFLASILRAIRVAKESGPGQPSSESSPARVGVKIALGKVSSVDMQRATDSAPVPCQQQLLKLHTCHRPRNLDDFVCDHATRSQPVSSSVPPPIELAIPLKSAGQDPHSRRAAAVA